MLFIALFIIFNYACWQIIKLVSWKYIRMVRYMNDTKKY